MIQIIEDDLVTCQIIAALLRRMRLPSCEAHSGAEAMDQLRTRPIDMVILDMVLPDLHGVELLERKYNLPYLSDIPVLCCTANADIDTVEAAMGFGAVDFVKKPIAIQVLADRVSRTLERAPARWAPPSELGRRSRLYGGGEEPLLVLARQVLRELDDLLAEAERGDVNVGELHGMVARARGTAQNVGALRTVQLLDRLWTGTGGRIERANLRAALVIEMAAFDEAIHSGGRSTGETPAGGISLYR